MLSPDPAPLLSSLGSPLRHRMTLRLLWRSVLPRTTGAGGVKVRCRGLRSELQKHREESSKLRLSQRARALGQ